jgi:hypothetical protein
MHHQCRNQWGSQDVHYCNDGKEVLPIGGARTNSTGWVNLSDGGGGIYYLNVSLPNSKLVFSLSIPVQI